MKKERLKELLPVMQAWVDGKTVQWLNTVGLWVDYEESAHNFYGCHQWRIKPEPKLREWVASEVPPLIYVKYINPPTNTAGTIGFVVGIKEGIGIRIDDQWNSFARCLESLLYSTDLKTWHPCGIETTD